MLLYSLHDVDCLLGQAVLERCPASLVLGHLLLACRSVHVFIHSLFGGKDCVLLLLKGEQLHLLDLFCALLLALRDAVVDAKRSERDLVG